MYSNELQVVDEQNPHRYLAANELEELYTYTEMPRTSLSKDEYNDGLRMFCISFSDTCVDVLQSVFANASEWIANFHIHDSLLLDNEDEHMTEAESADAVAGMNVYHCLYFLIF